MKGEISGSLPAHYSMTAITPSSHGCSNVGNNDETEEDDVIRSVDRPVPLRQSRRPVTLQTHTPAPPRPFSHQRCTSRKGQREEGVVALGSRPVAANNDTILLFLMQPHQMPEGTGP